MKTSFLQFACKSLTFLGFLGNVALAGQAPSLTCVTLHSHHRFEIDGSKATADWFVDQESVPVYSWKNCTGGEGGVGTIDCGEKGDNLSVVLQASNQVSVLRDGELLFKSLQCSAR